jgi:hypothetical protein
MAWVLQVATIRHHSRLDMPLIDDQGIREPHLLPDLNAARYCPRLLQVEHQAEADILSNRRMSSPIGTLYRAQSGISQYSTASTPH